MNNNNKLSSALIICFAILIAGLKFAYNNKLFEHIYNFERTYYKFEVKCENAYSYCTDLKGKPLTGFLNVYHQNGNLDFISYYKNGKLDGISKTYYENGQLESEASYKNNKLDGISKGYYENGKLKYEIPYTNGKPKGTLKTYDENGQVNKKILLTY